MVRLEIKRNDYRRPVHYWTDSTRLYVRFGLFGWCWVTLGWKYEACELCANRGYVISGDGVRHCDCALGLNSRQQSRQVEAAD